MSSGTDFHTSLVPVASDVALSVRLWPGGGAPFLLLHGLSSNARTWDAVAGILHGQGYTVVTADLRGHGRSSKPDGSYDFATISGDLAALIGALGLDRPVVAGQSWGGNVVLDLGSRHPDLVSAVVGVDGGTISLHKVFPTWEACAAQLAPPRLEGARLADLRARIQAGHSDWSASGVEGTLHNFEHLPDGTVRPWLTFDRHMAILRHLYDYRPEDIYPLLTMPVMLIGAVGGGEREYDSLKRAFIAEAVRAIPKARDVLVEGADHDVHVQQPELVAGLLVEMLG